MLDRFSLNLVRNEHEFVFRMFIGNIYDQIIITTGTSASCNERFLVTLPGLNYFVVPFFGCDIQNSVETSITHMSYSRSPNFLQQLHRTFIFDNDILIRCPEYFPIEESIPFEIWGVRQNPHRHDICVNVMRTKLFEVISPILSYGENGLGRADYFNELSCIGKSIHWQIDHPIY